MRWKEIVTEATDYNCPECGDYLGKESEVIANDNEYCGRCGWQAKPRKAAQTNQAPKPAPKPVPKSKQTLVKKSGDFEARVYPGRKTAGLYYLGKTTYSMDISGGCVGEVAKSESGFRATRRLMHGRTADLGTHATMGQALNTLKARFKAELKKYSAKK